MQLRIRWSLDGARLIVGDDDSSILDSATGHLLARIDPEARSPQPRSFVSPDLGYVVRRGREGWSLQPLATPEAGSPGRVLQTILGQTGLRLNGVELALDEASAAP